MEDELLEHHKEQLGRLEVLHSRLLRILMADFSCTVEEALEELCRRDGKALAITAREK